MQGQRILSIWFALDDVTVEPSGVEVRKRSHRWGNEYRPIHSGGDTEACKVLPGATLPASDALWNGPGSTRHAVYADTGAGDCRLHHGLTMHGAPGNAGSTRRRRAFATRWSGDAVVCAPREGPARITIDEPACRAGEPIGCAVFPRLWPR